MPSFAMVSRAAERVVLFIGLYSSEYALLNVSQITSHEQASHKQINPDNTLVFSCLALLR